MSGRRPSSTLLAVGLAVLLLLAVVLGFLWLRRPPAPETATAAWRRLAGDPATAPLDVVLITIDTLRADRLGCYGSRRVATPHLDRLAAEGVRFANAATTVAFTLPAHSSLMTGVYPPRHGVRENVGYALDETLPTLAETLAAAGWSTGGFVSAFVLDSRWGIGRGFETYYDDFEEAQPEAGAVNLGSVQRDGAETVAEAVRWLDGQRDQGQIDRQPRRPTFLWLHLFDPHDPYTPPEPYRSAYPGRPYDAEVAYADELVGRFRAALEERGLLERTLLVVTADHGEGLGQHGEGFHGFFVYDSTVHVPLIVRPPFGDLGDLAGRVVDEPVSHVDLLPTVLEAVGQPVPETAQGRSLLPLLVGQGDGGDGRSGTGDGPAGRSASGGRRVAGDLAEGHGGERDAEAPGEVAAGAAERAVYSESMYPLLHYGWAPLRSVRTRRYKFILAPRPELYDLVADPLEERNLLLDERRTSRRLRDLLDAMVERLGSGAPPAGQTAELDEETLLQLEALGYVAGRGGVPLDEEDAVERADPKDRIGLHQLVMAAQSELGKGEDEKARELLERAVATDDTMVDAHQMLGTIALRRDRHEPAAEHFRAALRVDQEHRQSLFGLAAAYRGLGRLEDALAGFERLRQLDPGDTRATLAAADVLERLDRRSEAMAVLEEAVGGDGPAAILLNKLGELEALAGDARSAAGRFERALEANPELVPARFNLAVLYEEAGRTGEAVAHYERVVEQAPRHFQAQFNLGRLYGQRGDLDRQQRLWEAALASNPDFVRGHYLLAKLLMDNGGDLARAEELARQGLERDPEHRAGALGYYVLADVLNRQGRRAEAAAAAQRGRQIQAGGPG